MISEKLCPLRAGQCVSTCAEERCAWWDDDGTVRGRGDSGCALLSVNCALCEIADAVRELPRGAGA